MSHRASSPDMTVGALSPRASLLRIVAEDGVPQLKTELENTGLNVNHVLDSCGNSLSHVAVTYEASDTLQWLLAENADPDAVDMAGQTPLHLASCSGDLGSVSTLLSAKADVSLVTNDRIVRIGRMPVYECGGRTALHVASTPEIVSLLVAAGSDSSAADFDGCTPWDVAVRDGTRPKTDVAAALEPCRAIPEMSEIETLRRNDFRVRAARLTLKEASERVLAESDEEDEDQFWDHDDSGDSSDEDGGGTTRTDADGEADGDEDAGIKPWSFRNLALQCRDKPDAKQDGLRGDTGGNYPRNMTGAHVWLPAASDLENAAAPFDERCVLASAGACRAVSGSDGCPPVRPPPEAYAWCYCGHQLGRFSGQLGDGAVLCARLQHQGRRQQAGQQPDRAEGERPGGQEWELSWKGIGRTPFSRLGTTGRKTVGACVREMLVGEALAALRVPCQRALAVFRSRSGGQQAERDEDAAAGGMLVRACGGAGFVRIGTMQVANGAEMDRHNGRAGPSAGDFELVTDLIAYVGGREGSRENQKGSVEAGARFVLERAVCAWALLVAKFSALGFVHGMLNTDNMQIEGIAVDVAGGLFMSTFQRDYDARAPPAARGRYAYWRQPRAAEWGLWQLARALSTGGMAIAEKEAEAIVRKFKGKFRAAWLREMRLKLGLRLTTDGSSDSAGRAGGQRGEEAREARSGACAGGTSRPRDAGLENAGMEGETTQGGQRAGLRRGWRRRADRALVRALLKTMEETQTDFTATFHALRPTPRSGAQFLDRLCAKGPPPLSPAARAQQLERRAQWLRPPEPRDLLLQLQLAAEDPLALPGLDPPPPEQRARLRAKAEARLAAHDKADALQGEAAAARASSALEMRAADEAAWDAWLAQYGERCEEQGGADATGMRAVNPRRVLLTSELDEAVEEAERGHFDKAKSVLASLATFFESDEDQRGDGNGGVVLTMGHSSLSADDFVQRLAAHGVATVFDVRSAPYSSRIPHFKKKALKALCEAHALTYVHVPELGGKEQGGVQARMQEDRGIQALCTIAIAARSAVGDEETAPARSTPCLLCAEADPRDCHRAQIADELLRAWGVRALHIGADGTLEPHTPGTGGHLQ